LLPPPLFDAAVRAPEDAIVAGRIFMGRFPRPAQRATARIVYVALYLNASISGNLFAADKIKHMIRRRILES
jgi:hypothetical protein